MWHLKRAARETAVSRQHRILCLVTATSDLREMRNVLIGATRKSRSDDPNVILCEHAKTLSDGKHDPGPWSKASIRVRDQSDCSFVAPAVPTSQEVGSDDAQLSSADIGTGTWCRLVSGVDNSYLEKDLVLGSKQRTQCRNRYRGLMDTTECADSHETSSLIIAGFARSDTGPLPF